LLTASGALSAGLTGRRSPIKNLSCFFHYEKKVHFRGRPHELKRRANIWKDGKDLAMQSVEKLFKLLLHCVPRDVNSMNFVSHRGFLLCAMNERGFPGEACPPSAAVLSLFPDQVQSVVFYKVQEWSDKNSRVPESESLHFTENEVDFITDFEHGRKLVEMLLCGLCLPACVFDQAADKLFPSTNQIDHAALIMANERNALNASDRDRVRDLEFTVPQIGAAGTDDVGKIVRNMQVLPIIHAHADEQLRV
jgi:hypothetical protein